VKQVSSISGQELREMFEAAVGWLEKNSSEIDALNVFPVPDGDTGTNMLLTMRSTMEEAYRAPDHSASAVAQAMARGALMGARGNSGVILSQILHGLAQGLTDSDACGAVDWANALQKSAVTAYKGVSNPVEGTILTVIREVAEAAQLQASREDEDLLAVMEVAVSTAGDSVANTPNLLPVLKEAGVVDSGGQGLYTLLDGALRYLRGESDMMQFRKPNVIVGDVSIASRSPQVLAADELPYGYCTEFLIKGENLDPEKIRRRLGKKGESVIVVGNESAVRVHLHTLDPGSVIHYATSLGTLHQVSARNMDEQHLDFLEMQKEKMPVCDTAVIAVASGEGLADVFRSLGASAVVSGGQTMNPSTKELLQVVEMVTADKLIILPNNKNIVTTAEQLHSLTNKELAVVPTKTIPQGVAALLALDYEANLKVNADLMKKAISSVRSIEITRSVRSTRIGNLKIKRKQPIGVLDGDLIEVGDSTEDVLSQMLARLDLGKAEVITIYYGADTEAAEAEQIRGNIQEQHPHVQIEVVRGGQPHYNYIVSIE